jgi:trans-2,3-dihydro-3-hydroxyanthranilate isomerase
MKLGKREYNYTVLDVFTDTKYSGNQLAVIHVDKDLELRVYENIAREFGYSESSFVYYSPADKALKIRSFTPTGFEIHGAGHNLLGVVCNALIKGEEIFRAQTGHPYVIMKDDIVYLEINQSSELPVVGMKQRAATFGKTVPLPYLAQGLSISDSNFHDAFLPTVVTTEVAHLMVALKDIDTLDNASSNKKILHSLGNDYGFEGVYCFSFTNDTTKNIVETRFFNPSIGIDEDAATGSAAGPLAGFLYKNGYIGLDVSYQLLQGKLQKQPSAIMFRVLNDSILVSGSSVITMEGKLYL